MRKYNVMYCLRDHDPIDSAIYRHATYDKLKPAFEERNLFFNRLPNVIKCWIERKNMQIGKILKRK